jgi:hypothetical protein
MAKFALIFALVAGIGGFAAYKYVFGDKLTEPQVVSYIKAYGKVRAEFPDVAKTLQQPGAVPDASTSGAVQRIDAIAKESGLSGFAEFIKLNGKVGLAFSRIQADAFMDQMKTQGAPVGANDQKGAEAALKVVELLVSDEEIAIVGKHKSALTKAYTGH